MPLTKDQIAAYLASPWVCPWCGAEGEDLTPSSIEGANVEDLDGTELMVQITCGKCGKSWRNYYKLHDIEEEDADGCAIPNDGNQGAVVVEPQKPEHAPLPWVAEPEEATEHRGIAICSPSGDAIVAVIAGDDRQADEIDWANAHLIVQGVNNHEDLVTAYEQVETAFLDALHTLNDAGLPCPVSLGLAMENLRQVVANAKKEG